MPLLVVRNELHVCSETSHSETSHPMVWVKKQVINTTKTQNRLAATVFRMGQGELFLYEECMIILKVWDVSMVSLSLSLWLVTFSFFPPLSLLLLLWQCSQLDSSYKLKVFPPASSTLVILQKFFACSQFHTDTLTICTNTTGHSHQLWSFNKHKNIERVPTFCKWCKDTHTSFTLIQKTRQTEFCW